MRLGFGIKNRLLVGMVLVLGLAAGGLLYHLQGLLREQTLERAIDYHQELVHAESLRISSAITDGSLLVMGLAQRAELRKLLLDSKDAVAQRRARLQLEGFLTANSGFSGAAIIGADYRLVMALSLHADAEPSDALWEAFFASGLDPFNAMAKVPVFIDPIQSDSLHRNGRIRYTIPVQDEDNVLLGILALDYDLDRLLRRLEVSSRPFAFMVMDDAGELLYGGDPQGELGISIGAAHSGLERSQLQAMLRNRSGHSVSRIGPQEQLMVHARLIGQEHLASPVTLVQLVPLQRIHEPVRFVNEALTISTLSTFLVILLVLGVYAYRVVSPVQMLAEKVSTYRPGAPVRLNKQMLQRQDEMGSLYRAFQQLGNELTTAFAERDSQYAALVENNRLLQQKTAEARELAKAKSDFLAIMSHEIRTPLNAIVGFSQLLCEETDPAEVAHSTSRILANSKRLLALIDNILDFTRIQSGRARLTKEVFSPFTELQTIHEAALPQLATSALDFAISYDGDPQVNLSADVVRWRQVVNNLVSNALKFTMEGSVHVSGMIREDEADPDTVWLDIVVTDTGVGIPQEKLEVIFHPFEQVDSSLNRRYEGSGLGLAISERLAELMGGRLQAQSEVGKGSTFRFSVPCGLVRDAAVEADDQAIFPTVDLAGYRLLIVEDDDNNAEVLRRHLLKAGAAVVDLAGEPQAFRRRMELSPYDLIFMDLHLRSVSGIELVRGLRAGEYAGRCRPDVPVFVLTAFTEPELAAEARSAGATRYFTKPASHEAILREVVRVIDSAKAGSQS